MLAIVVQVPILAQYASGKDVDSKLISVGYHTGNRAAVSFYNDGQIAGFNTEIDIRGEWPLGSGENYIGDCIPLIGVEFVMGPDTLHSIEISRGPRSGQFDERHPIANYAWAWNPISGYRNPNSKSVAMSHLPDTWPIEGWNDAVAKDWKDENGATQWFGYFGRSITNATQESFFLATDQESDEFNFPATERTTSDRTSPATRFIPDANDPMRHGMGLKLAQRGFQWSSFLAQDCIFWLYNITNEGTHTYAKSNFGVVVGTLAGGDGDSNDDMADFRPDDQIIYSYDFDGLGNIGQKVGYIGYAFLESPGNPYDGIDNDGDSRDASSPMFTATDFAAVTYKIGDQIVEIDPVTYERTVRTINAFPFTANSLGKTYVLTATTVLREGHIAGNRNGVDIPDVTANNGQDDDLDGLIDENEAIHYKARVVKRVDPLRYINYKTGAGLSDPLINEKRDNTFAQDGWASDEDGDWSRNPNTGEWIYNESGWLADDVGSDGLSPLDEDYPGPDADGTENNGTPDQGEPNYGVTDTEESDQIGLTSFDYFELTIAPNLSNDENLWTRMTPGAFDLVDPRPMDGDFIFASGYFPLLPKKIERFSTALVFGADLQEIEGNKRTVQNIYNAGYNFPKPPLEPILHLAHEDGKVVLYWDGDRSENSVDFITKEKDFQGYKIYRATEENFRDSRTITNNRGNLVFDKPIAQYDLIDSISGNFYPSRALSESIGGILPYMGKNDNGFGNPDDQNASQLKGITNIYVDSLGIVPGVTYYYAVSAYDRGDESSDILPEENPKTLFRDETGNISFLKNTGSITPGARPVGFVAGSVTDVTKSANFVGTGNISVNVVDNAKVNDGYEYKVKFQSKIEERFRVDGTGRRIHDGYHFVTSGWSLIDLQSPDTVYIPKTNQTFIVKPGESITIPAGVETIVVNSVEMAVKSNTYKAIQDTLVNRLDKFVGGTPVHQGFKVDVFVDPVRFDSAKTVYAGTDTTFKIPTIARWEWLVSDNPQKYNGYALPNDYMFEFSDVVVGQSVVDKLPRVRGSRIDTITTTAKDIKFRVKNLTTNKYIDVVYDTLRGLNMQHNVYFKEMIDGVERRTWRVTFVFPVPGTPLYKNGTFTVSMLKPFDDADELTFKMKAPKIDAASASENLKKIKVVPNPYVVTNVMESRLSSFTSTSASRGERTIKFTHIPPGAKISIYTVRGEKIKTLYHNDINNGDVKWNLRTEENIDVAYGVYIYVVEVPEVGTKIDKFALIK